MNTEVDRSEAMDAPGGATAIKPKDHEQILEETQQTSMLLQLSAEIRNMILEFSFLDTVVRFQNKRVATKDMTVAPRYQSSVGLLLACRQTRWEATAFFQAHSVIDIQDNWPKRVVRVISPAACAAIQCIRITPVDGDDFRAIVSCLSSLVIDGGPLKSLRKITICDSSTSWFPRRSVAEPVFRELSKETSHQENRTLELEWDYAADGEKAQVLSYNIVIAE